MLPTLIYKYEFDAFVKWRIFNFQAVPYGKVTLRNALHAIGMHQQDPEQWTAKKIAYEYKLDEGLTGKAIPSSK